MVSKLALTELHLTQQCLVCQPYLDDIDRMVKNPDIKQVGNEERRAKIASIAS